MQRAVKLGAIALVGCAVVFSSAYLYLNRSDFDKKRNDDLAHYKADVMQREEAKKSFADTLVKIQAAEALTDPRQRCLQYPDLPGTHWDPALIAELCRVNNLDVVTLDQIEKSLAEKDAASVDRIFDEYAKRDTSDPAWHGVWFRAFTQIFEINSARVGAVVEKWVKLSPKSANALVARAVYRINRGYELRGPASAHNTPDESIAAMQESIRAGIEDLQAALKLDPRYKPALVELMYASKGNNQAVDDAGTRALPLDPTDDMTYYVWMGAANPNWGGTAERRQAILDAAQSYRDRYPLLDVLQSRKNWFEQSRQSNSPTDYVAIIDKAPENYVLDAAAGDYRAANRILFASELIRFQPSAKNYLLRHDLLASLPEFRGRAAWIANDLASAAKVSASSRTKPEDRAATLLSQGNKAEAAELYRQILQDNPRKIATIYALINIDLENNEHREEADALANRLVELQPDYPVTWSYMAAAAHGVNLQKFCAMTRKYHELGGDGELNYEYECRNFVMRRDVPEENAK